MTSSFLQLFPCHCLSHLPASPGPTFFHPHELTCFPCGHLSSIPCSPPRGKSPRQISLPTKAHMQKGPSTLSQWATSVHHLCLLGQEKWTTVSRTTPFDLRMQMISYSRSGLLGPLGSIRVNWPRAGTSQGTAEKHPFPGPSVLQDFLQPQEVGVQAIGQMAPTDSRVN